MLKICKSKGGYVEILTPRRMVLRGGTFGSQTVEAVKNLPASEGDARDSNLITGLGRSLGEGNDNTLQYSCLGNPMGRGACWATVPGVTKESDTTQ